MWHFFADHRIGMQVNQTVNRDPLEDIARSWALAQPLVRAFIAGAITNIHDAQDVLQDVAVAAISGAERPDLIIVSFNSWVLGIARHRVADYYRKSGKRVRFLDDDILDQLEALYASWPEDWSRRMEALDHCVFLVKGRSRQLLEMRYKANLSSEEMAVELGSSPSAIRTALMRLRTMLRECIEDRLKAGAT